MAKKIIGWGLGLSVLHFILALAAFAIAFDDTMDDFDRDEPMRRESQDRYGAAFGTDTGKGVRDMMLFHLAGHSGAGKSRLIAALPKFGINVPRSVLYTSRRPRPGEVHGKDYYFLSRGAIASLPGSAFFVGPVREMLEAVDLVQLEEDLRSDENRLVLIEIFADLWLKLRPVITERLGGQLPTRSIFLTAVDPEMVRSFPDNELRGLFIENEVTRNLTWRSKDEPDKIALRSKSAVNEILAALGLVTSGVRYDDVLHSSPEGPDGQDDWTRGDQPIGRAKDVIERVIALIEA